MAVGSRKRAMKLGNVEENEPSFIPTFFANSHDSRWIDRFFNARMKKKQKSKKDIE